MSLINTSSPIVQEKQELEAVCAALELKDIKYLPSPKEKNGNISDLTKHATLMLKIYKRQIDGEDGAPIREIFADE